MLLVTIYDALYLGLTTRVKTIASKGFHVVVLLYRECGYGDVAAFAHRAGGLLARRHPDQLTQEFSKVR